MKSQVILLKMLDTLDIKCDETGVNVQAVLPHEVLYELNKMIGDSLKF